MTQNTKEEKTVDWELVERHFRAGILSNVQIANECGVTEGAIRKKAKKENWVKDLSVKIKQRAKELVRAELVRAPGTSLTPVTEKETVEVNAQATAVVLIAQKGTIKRLHDLSSKLLSELEIETDNLALFERLGELLNTDDDDAEGKADKLNKMEQLYRRVISSSGRIDSAKKLAEIFEKVVKMEREAFGMNETDGGGNDVDAVLRKINAEFGQ